jgi:hypothetical protein
MSNQDSKEQENQGASTRAGGNVQTKGASQAPTSDERAEQSGGDAPSKSAGGDQPPPVDPGKES